MAHEFVIADVFTDTPFGGNQLAVFPEAQGLSARAMQAFAHEINFAESTFVLPPADPRHACRVRIFTPKAELPFAGHPTVGTAAVLAHLGTMAPATETMIFEEGIGPVAVEIDTGDGRCFTRLVVEQPVERPPTNPSRRMAAAALSLAEDAVLDSWFAGLGVRFAFAHLRDKAAVDGAALDRAAWSANFARAWASAMYLFSGDPSPGGELYARMFAPAFGIEEDPATGSGAAALAAVLAERLPEKEGAFAWRIVQGVALGRPSLIEAAAEKRWNRPARLTVGGCTVITGEGRMNTFPGY
ncbi:MAG: PhzF family phenazine biosynthesis protein [Alphaproteobacteria bacterium]|nr:PhzF family phenazine biosynthesis protein [Alphaproteobacteria bacterium]